MPAGRIRRTAPAATSSSSAVISSRPPRTRSAAGRTRAVSSGQPRTELLVELRELASAHLERETCADHVVARCAELGELAWRGEKTAHAVLEGVGRPRRDQPRSAAMLDDLGSAADGG